MGDRGCLPVDDPELEPQDASAGRHGLDRVGHAQVRSPEHVDHVDRPGRCDGRGQVRLGRQPEHLPLVRVHRHAVQTEADERSEHAMGRPRGIGRRADDGDPPGRAQHPLDARVVEDLDRSATLLEVEERSGPIAFLPGQVAASRS